MAGELTLTGIVLSSTPVGEYDRRLSILTCEKGRISAFALGARRPMSGLRAVSRLFTYAKFYVFPKRDSYSVTGCESPIFFDELSMDPEKSYFGMYFCELLSFFTRENADEREQVKLLFTSLKALLKGKMPLNMIRRVFEIRAIANYGEAPYIFECCLCHKKTDVSEWTFNIKQGTLFCPDCAKQMSSYNIQKADTNIRDILKISETVRYAMHYCITTPYKSLFAFGLTPEAEKSFTTCVDRFMKNHIDKPIKSLDLLDVLGYNGE